MGQMEDLRAFVLIVDNESIGKAAELEGIAKSAMSRRLRLLEERLGTELIARTTRQWSLTSAGNRYYSHAKSICSAMDAADADITKEKLDKSGEIRLAAPLHFGMRVLAKWLTMFSADHPGIHLSVDFDDRFVDLIGEQYDLAVRISHPADSSLVARTIGKTKRIFCASPEYLGNAPELLRPDDLKHHKIIQHGRAKRFKWSLCPVGGKTVEVQLKASFNSNNGEMLLQAAAAGLGVLRIPDFLAAEALRDGKLVRVLESCEPPPLPISIVFPATHHQPHRVRMLIEFLSRSAQR